MSVSKEPVSARPISSEEELEISVEPGHLHVGAPRVRAIAPERARVVPAPLRTRTVEA